MTTEPDTSDTSDPTHPARPMQELLDREVRAVPGVLREVGEAEIGLEGVPRERYVSHAWHDLEVQRVWHRVWQYAAREEQIPNVGDTVVYDVADLSVIVVRSAPDRVRAFHNSCLHRGTQLRTQDGSALRIRCPFHGFTWDLDGGLIEVPCAWDFPQIDPAEYRLPELLVDTWGGFVFVNPDPDAAPLADYLGDLPRHFEPWPLEDRYTSAHVERVVPCNWKVALEAFLESYHTVAVHPQLLKTTADTITEYDVYPDQPHWSRMITPVGMSSEHVAGRFTEQDVLDAMFMTRDDPDVRVVEGGYAREVLAERVRADLASRTGRDWSALSDSEALDGIEYFVFPNFVPWAGFTTPLVYRFRPAGDDPTACRMEVMLLEPLPAGDERRPPAPVRRLGPDEKWADAPELGFFGRILDQDTATLGRIQRGLTTSVRNKTTLSQYQEIRIRHFHQVLGRYVDGG